MSHQLIRILRTVIFFQFLFFYQLYGQIPITKLEGYLDLSLPDDSTQVFVGYKSGQLNMPISPGHNTHVGYKAGVGYGNGKFNSFFGSESGKNVTNGANNTFMGYIAGRSTTNGYQNTILGSFAGATAELGNDNVMIGVSSGQVSSASKNTFCGAFSGAINSSGEENTLVGYQAGRFLTSGMKNSFLGSGAGKDIDSGVKNVCIGNNAGPTFDKSHRLYIDVKRSDRPLIYGEFDNNILRTYGRFEVRDSVGTQNLIVEESSGNLIVYRGKLGVGIDPGDFKLKVNGSAAKPGGGAWDDFSDRRLKKNIASLDSEEMLERILSMQGVSYNWNNDLMREPRPEAAQIGFIAQDLQKIWPDKVKSDKEGYLYTAYGNYDPVFVEAIKAQQQLIEKLEKRIAALEELQEGSQQ